MRSTDTWRQGITAKNFGTTPAYSAYGLGELLIGPATMGNKSGPRPAQLQSDGPRIKVPIAPQDSMAITLKFGDSHPAQILTSQEKATIQFGSMLLFAFGVIYYDDVFGHSHTTEFRLEYGGIDAVRLGKMRWSTAGNDAN
jgi:hypothetical protein